MPRANRRRALSVDTDFESCRTAAVMTFAVIDVWAQELAAGTLCGPIPHEIMNPAEIWQLHRRAEKAGW